MRTTKLLLLAVFVTTTTFAQKPGIKVDMFAPIVKTFNVAIERPVSENGAWQIGFTITSDNETDYKFRRFGFTPEYRFYLSETPAPAGFFVAPFIQYFDVKESRTYPNTDESYSEFAAGLVTGYQWLFKERVTFQIYAGPKYNTNNRDPNASSGAIIELDKGFIFRGGVTLGVVF